MIHLSSTYTIMLRIVGELIYL